MVCVDLYIMRFSPPSPAKKSLDDLILYLIPSRSSHLTVTASHSSCVELVVGGVWVEIEAQLLWKYGKDMAHYYNDIINVIIDKKQQWMCKASGRICAEQSAFEVHRQ